jgi:hypothetical protein
MLIRSSSPACTARPFPANATYAAQFAARNASLFGAADFYARNFVASGHVAANIHVNNDAGGMGARTRRGRGAVSAD